MQLTPIACQREWNHDDSAYASLQASCTICKFKIQLKGCSIVCMDYAGRIVGICARNTPIVVANNVTAQRCKFMDMPAALETKHCHCA